MSAETIILNIAYVGLLASTFTRTITKLRLLLIAAAICFVVFGILTDNISMILWNIVTGALHAFGVAKDERTRRSVTLSEAEAEVRTTFFGEMSEFDFNLLWRLGTPVISTDELLIVASEPPETVSLILDGNVEIWSGQTKIRELRKGALIGEMSFVSGHAAVVDVRTRGRVLMHEWQQQDLASLDQVCPSAARAFRAYVSGDLAAKARV